MPEAVSGQQAALFRLALGVKTGNIPASKVTSNVRQIAKDTSLADLEDLAGTDTAKLPDKVSGGEKSSGEQAPELEEGGSSMGPHDFWAQYTDEHPDASDEEINNAYADHQADLTDRTYDTARDNAYHFGGGNMKETDTGMGASMPSAMPSTQMEKQVNINDVVGRYNEYGKAFKRQPMTQLALELAQIAELAEAQLVSEDSNDWYDKHTIQRNVKEMKAYSKEFEKLAEEADEYNTRMEALYADMGRVLERYFDIYDPADKDGKMLTEPSVNSTDECGSSCSGGITESTDVPNDELTMRALPLVRKKLSEGQRIIFDRLPPTMKRKVIWRLL